MEKIYKKSRIVLSIMAFLIFSIMIINEDASWWIVPIIFGVITYGISFPSTIVSKIILYTGDKIKSKFLKLMYYLFLPVIIVFCCFFAIYVLFTIGSNATGGLSQALIFLFFMAVACVCIILPYIQTIIVLILRKYEKTMKTIDSELNSDK